MKINLRLDLGVETGVVVAALEMLAQTFRETDNQYYVAVAERLSKQISEEIDSVMVEDLCGPTSTDFNNLP